MTIFFARNLKLLLFSIAFVLPFFKGHAQTKTIDIRQQTWLAYFNQTRLSKNSGVWLDLHHRLTEDFVRRNALSIARIGYIYYLKDHARFTAGYAYASQYSVTNPNVPEHRPWQQFQWFEKKNGFGMMQWIRVEQRFRRHISEGALSEDFSFNWRFRYNMSFTIPLQGKTVEPKTPFIFLNNELHVNAGKNIVYNYFDQNRLFAGMGYQFGPHLNAHFGYMNVFQQLAAGNNYASIHAMRLFVFHNLDLRMTR